MIREAALAAQIQIDKKPNHSIWAGGRVMSRERARSELDALSGVTGTDVLEKNVIVTLSVAELLRKGAIGPRAAMIGDMQARAENRLQSVNLAAVAAGERRIAELGTQMAGPKHLYDNAPTRSIEGQIDTVQAALAGEDPAEGMALIERKRYKTLLDQVMTQKKALELIDDMGDSQEDNMDVVQEIAATSLTNLDTMAELLKVSAELDTYDEARVEKRKKETDELVKQTKMVSSLADAALAAKRIADSAPWQKLFEAAGGGAGFGSALSARQLAERAGGFFGGGETGRGMEDFADAYKAAKKYGEVVHKTEKDAIALIDDEIVRRRMLREENRRYARELAMDWQIQEQAMRKAGATEGEIALAHKQHMVMLGQLGKEADKGRDKVKEVIAEIIGAPNDMIRRFLSPAGVARNFPGSSLASMVGQLGGSRPQPAMNVMVQVRVDGIPENMIRIVDQRVQSTTQSAFRQSNAAMSY